MGIGIRTGESYREIGAPSFFQAFFSTVSANLEPKGWGSRFPAVVNVLYQGRLPATELSKARTELSKIHEELGGFPPAAVVWDIKDRSKVPPWGDEIDPRITSLANYFVTSDGHDLFDVLFAALEEASRNRLDVRIE